MALIKCKECGNELSKKAKECPNCGSPAKKKTSLFTWIISGTLALGIIGAMSNNENSTSPKNYPSSNATYAQINTEIGCKSKYSDDKKEDIFNSKYKNHWMTWRGKIELAEADNASLNMDNFGTQDIRVEFTDKKAGYDLTKGSTITVKFLMSRTGGCFLPFSGKQAVIM